MSGIHSPSDRNTGCGARSQLFRSAIEVSRIPATCEIDPLPFGPGCCGREARIQSRGNYQQQRQGKSFSMPRKSPAASRLVLPAPSYCWAIELLGARMGFFAIYLGQARPLASHPRTDAPPREIYIFHSDLTEFSLGKALRS
jgi:hypothetical protein